MIAKWRSSARKDRAGDGFPGAGKAPLLNTPFLLYLLIGFDGRSDRSYVFHAMPLRSEYEALFEH
jgi:hypothetical protein